MNFCKTVMLGLLTSSLSILPARADERRFTYTYEPETLPAGAIEAENWVTLGAGRNATVGQENYNRWDLRQEVEYGVTDWYSAALYFNEQAQSFRVPGSDANQSEFRWQGLSLENRFNVLNPATHKIGLTLYLEGRYSGEEAELEEKIIIGQRVGEWKWAFNLIHGTDWEDNLSRVEGECGASFGLARDFGKHWSLGLEFRNENVLPEYKAWESSAFFLGPTLSYRQEKWWTALSVMPQIYGWNNSSNPDGDSHRELRDHEKVNVRWLIGFDF